MSEKDYDKADMIRIISEVFVEGYKYAVEIATYLEQNIEKEYQAKHKKILTTLIEDMKKTAATIDKETLKQIAEEWLKEKTVEKELMENTPKTVIHKPSLSQIKRYNIQRGGK